MPGVALDLVCSKHVTATWSESSKNSILNSWAGKDARNHPPPISQKRQLRLQGGKALSQGPRRWTRSRPPPGERPVITTGAYTCLQEAPNMSHLI